MIHIFFYLYLSFDAKEYDSHFLTFNSSLDVKGIWFTFSTSTIITLERSVEVTILLCISSELNEGGEGGVDSLGLPFSSKSEDSIVCIGIGALVSSTFDSLLCSISPLCSSVSDVLTPFFLLRLFFRLALSLICSPT